jgi:hypothetical protein
VFDSKFIRLAIGNDCIVHWNLAKPRGRFRIVVRSFFDDRNAEIKSSSAQITNVSRRAAPLMQAIARTTVAGCSALSSAMSTAGRNVPFASKRHCLGPVL